MKKDREIQEIKNQVDDKLRETQEENLMLKHSIVHLKAELMELEKAV